MRAPERSKHSTACGRRRERVRRYQSETTPPRTSCAKLTRPLAPQVPEATRSGAENGQRKILEAVDQREVEGHHHEEAVRSQRARRGVLSTQQESEQADTQDATR
jgi:hypothetical protein